MTAVRKVLAVIVIGAWALISPLIVMLVSMSIQAFATGDGSHPPTGLWAALGGVDGRPRWLEVMAILACWFLVPKKIWRRITQGPDAAEDIEVPPPLPVAADNGTSNAKGGQP